MDRLTGWLLCAMMVFSPWALGSVPRWAIWTMNTGGYLLGLLWLVPKLGRWGRTEQPPRWNQNEPRWIARTLAGLTIGLLLWTLTSALNAKSYFVPGENRLQDYAWHISWLPHSYDGPSTWFALWTYLGLACVFWAARDWLTTVTKDERPRWEVAQAGRPCRATVNPVGRGCGRATLWRMRTWLGGSLAPPATAVALRGSRPDPYLPRNLRTLLWVLSINGGILALVSIVQRLDGTPKLLWLFPGPGIQAQFGPFDYRANAAQYFNLLWPLTLGFWWALGLQRGRFGASFERVGSSPRMLLPFTAVVMAAAPFISTTRGGAFIAAALLLAVAVFFAFAPEHQVGWRRWVGLGVCTTGALLGLYLGWEKLEPRVFKLVWARSLDLVAPLHDFALRLRLEVPSDAVTNWTHLASLSDVDRYPGNQPGAFTLTIGRGGELNVRLNRPDGAGSVSSVYLDFAKRAAGREVELVVSRRTDLKVEVDGQALIARKGTPGGHAEWDLPIEPRYLVFGGRSSPASGSFYRLLSVRLETTEKTAAMLDHTAQRPDAARDGIPQVAAATSVVLAAVEDAQNPERRFFVSNTADWSGREALYENARAMALRLPVLLGAGPGTFGALLLAYATVQGGAYHQHAHNDWLESRITLGAMVTGGLLLGLLVILLRPLQPGGGVMPPQLVWLIWLALGGVLVHARFDYPFQVHAIVNLVLVQLALLSGAESGAAVSR